MPYFRYPSLVEKWKDIIHCDTWQEDQVFVEQRLAALNPMSLQRVTAKTGSSGPSCLLNDRIDSKWGSRRGGGG